VLIQREANMEDQNKEVEICMQQKVDLKRVVEGKQQRQAEK
jgi:hypothetical protein